jgi:dTMP kinase
MNVADDSTLVCDAVSPGFGLRHGLIITVEGVWGAGKSTVAREVGHRLTKHGFAVTTLHYGPRHGIIAQLSQILENEPLRSRKGTGGYDQPHHATIDVLLRLCREAHHHRHHYLPATTGNDVVIIDHGVYSKLAYAVTVLTEHPPAGEASQLSTLLERLLACVRPWFLHPDTAFFLDVPWPLARERAIDRGSGGGDAASIERLLFLPRFDAAYRQVITYTAAARPSQVVTVPAATRDAMTVATDIEHRVLALLGA